MPPPLKLFGTGKLWRHRAERGKGARGLFGESVSGLRMVAMPKSNVLRCRDAIHLRRQNITARLQVPMNHQSLVGMPLHRGTSQLPEQLDAGVRSQLQIIAVFMDGFTFSQFHDEVGISFRQWCRHAIRRAIFSCSNPARIWRSCRKRA